MISRQQKMFEQQCDDARRIVCTQYSMGDEIVEMKIAEALKSDKKTARRVIDELVSRRIIDKTKRQRSRVATVDFQKAKEVIGFLSHQECYPASIIVQHDGDLAPLTEAKEAMQTEVRKNAESKVLSSEQRYDLHACNERFHLSLCTAAKTPEALRHMQESFHSAILFLMPCKHFDIDDFISQTEDQAEIIQMLEKPESIGVVCARIQKHYLTLLEHAMNMHNTFAKNWQYKDADQV